MHPLLALVAYEEPTTKQILAFASVTLPALALLAIVTPKDQRARLRTPTLLLGAWALFVVVASTRWFALGTRDVAGLLSSVAGALGAARIAWVLIIDVLLREGSRIGLSKLARDLLHAVLMIFVAISAARAAGADAQALATTGGLVTAGLTFSLQQTLGDLVAGILLSARAPFEVGDWIGYDDDARHIGRVIEINWRDTRLQTNDEVEVVVPNSTLSKAAIRIYTKPKPLSRRIVTFDVGYQHAPHDVVEAVRDAINSPLNGVLTTPKADVILVSFEDSAVRFAVRFFIEDFPRRDLIDSEVRMRLWYALHRVGIDFQFPRIEVETLTQQHLDPEAKMQRRADALSRVDFLGQMQHDDVLALAKSSRTRVFHHGEVIVRAGDSSTELYVLASGECVVTNAQGRELARLGPGDFFGEMALLTGEPRSATVSAVTPCTLHVLQAETFRTVIARYPEKLEQVSQVVAERQAEIEQQRGADVSQELKAKQQVTLLSRMRRFFAGEHGSN